MSADDLVVIATAGLLATACALLGTFLVLRREALLSDAVSHAVLPGIVVVFLLTGGRAVAPMVLGAAAFGVLCVLGVEALRRTGLVGSDAAIALVFPALFALGVVGVTRFADGVHLDLDATIYGEIAFAPLRTVELLGRDVPSSLLVSGGGALLALAVVGGLWRPLRAGTFDPSFAELGGLRGRAVARALLVAVAVVAVLAFESVGAILVVTFLIVPAATAHLLARGLAGMLACAVGVGWLSAIAGQRAASALDASVPGAIGVAAAACFVLAALLAPGRGALLRALRTRGARRRGAAVERRAAGARAAGG